MIPRLLSERPGLPLLCIEIKSTENVRETDLTRFSRLTKDIPNCEAVCFSKDRIGKCYDQVQTLPWEIGIKRRGGGVSTLVRLVLLGKECWPAHRAGPLRSQIRRRHELRCHITRPHRMRHRQKSRDTPSWRGSRSQRGMSSSIRCRDRALLVGISDNQARINRKALTADQASCNTGFNDTLENPAQHIALTEPLMADA